MRPLSNGEFEIVAEDEAASFLEIVEEGAGEDGDESRENGSGNFEEAAQIVITQDAEGRLLVEGTPLQFLLEASGGGDGQQQELQVLVNTTQKNK